MTVAMPMALSFSPHTRMTVTVVSAENNALTELLPSRMTPISRSGRLSSCCGNARAAVTGFGLVPQPIAVEGDQAISAAEKNADRKTRKIRAPIRALREMSFKDCLPPGLWDGA